MAFAAPKGRLAVALLVAVAAVVWAAERSDAQLTLGFEPVATGLGSPLGLVHAGDGSGRLFLVEQISDRWGVELNGRTQVWFELGR